MSEQLLIEGKILIQKGIDSPAFDSELKNRMALPRFKIRRHLNEGREDRSDVIGDLCSLETLLQEYAEIEAA